MPEGHDDHEASDAHKTNWSGIQGFSLRAFLIILVAGMALYYDSSNVFYPGRPPILNHILSVSILQESLHLVFSLPIPIFTGTGAYNILLTTCPTRVLNAIKEVLTRIISEFLSVCDKLLLLDYDHPSWNHYFS